MERTGAAAYHVLWSEEAIRKLMCSEKLRDVSACDCTCGNVTNNKL